MPHPVFPGKIVHRRMIAHVLEQYGRQHPFAPVGQKHRSRLGPGRQDVVDPVRFLDFPGQFVPLDNAFFIVLQGSHGHQANLDISPHLLPVNIVAGLGILFQLAFGNVVFQVFPGLGVDLGIRFGNAFRQIGFCPADPDKAQGILFQDFPGLGSAHYIIG